MVILIIDSADYLELDHVVGYGLKISSEIKMTSFIILKIIDIDIRLTKKWNCMNGHRNFLRTCFIYNCNSPVRNLNHTLRMSLVIQPPTNPPNGALEINRNSFVSVQASQFTIFTIIICEKLSGVSVLLKVAMVHYPNRRQLTVKTLTGFPCKPYKKTLLAI